MRKILSAMVLVLGLSVAPLAAHASPVTYDLTLSELTGNVGGGTGSLTVDNTPNYLGDVFTENGPAGNALTDLVLNIGGNIFTLANDGANDASVTFLFNQLTSVNYAGTLGNGFFKITFNSLGIGYLYTDLLHGETSGGLILASPAAATPEPASFLLFGTGALGLAAFGMRKLVA